MPGEDFVSPFACIIDYIRICLCVDAVNVSLKIVYASSWYREWKEER